MYIQKYHLVILMLVEILQPGHYFRHQTPIIQYHINVYFSRLRCYYLYHPKQHQEQSNTHFYLDGFLATTMDLPVNALVLVRALALDTELPVEALVVVQALVLVLGCAQVVALVLALARDIVLLVLALALALLNQDQTQILNIP